MKGRGAAPEKLGDLMRSVYRTREKVAIDEGWQGTLMARVRQVGGVEGKPRFLPAFERLVWKLVPISLPMSVGMVFLLARLYATAHYAGVQLFARYVEELTLRRILGG
jgi:hypothetical protein